MKIIALMPVKNEAWILPYSIKTLSEFCDVVIVADQRSNDNSRDILAHFPKVVVIDNNAQGHSNVIRWKLLDRARDYEGFNLILSVDADEIIPPQLFKEFLNHHLPSIKRGTWLDFWWVQLWKSIHYYRNDSSVWSNNWKPIGFLDDRELTYANTVVINDHTARVPGPPRTPHQRVLHAPLLHFQWVVWTRSQMKQAWYRCCEFLHERSNPVIINQKYAITLEDPAAGLTPAPAAWLRGLGIPEDFAKNGSDWHLQDILRWFQQYGISHFEPLEIWHIPELQNIFLKQMGREPRSSSAPLFWRLKQGIKKLIRKGI